MNTSKATLIYLEDCIVLSKKVYNDWREIQDEYCNTYKTNFPPLNCEEIIAFFKDDFREEKYWPFSKKEIVDFFKSNSETIRSS